MYSNLCYVEADLSHLPKPGKYSTYIHDLYYEINFDVILALGLTEFNAFIAWREKVMIVSVLCTYFLLNDRSPLSLNLGCRKKVRLLYETYYMSCTDNFSLGPQHK